MTMYQYHYHWGTTTILCKKKAIISSSENYVWLRWVHLVTFTCLLWVSRWTSSSRTRLLETSRTWRRWPREGSTHACHRRACHQCRWLACHWHGCRGWLWGSHVGRLRAWRHRWLTHDWRRGCLERLLGYRACLRRRAVNGSLSCTIKKYSMVSTLSLPLKYCDQLN